MEKFSKIFKNILYWLNILTIVFIPLYPKLPLFNVKGTFIAVRLEDFLVSLVLLLWGVYILLSKQVWLTLKNRILQTFLLFFGIGLLSVFSGVFLTHSVTLNLGVLNWLRRVELMMLAPVLWSVVDSKKQIKQILAVLSAVTLIVVIYAFGQQYLHWPVISTTNSEFSKGQILYLTPGARANSTFAGYYDLAIYLMMVLVVVTAIFFALNKRLKVVSAVLFMLSFVVLIMTAARQSFAAAVIGILLALLLTGKKKLIIGFMILLLVAVIYPSQLRDRLISTVTVNLLHQGERYTAQSLGQANRSQLNIPTLATTKATQSAEASKSASASGKIASDITPGEPVDTTQLGVYRSFEIRFKVEWPRAIRALEKNPFLGTGYSSIGEATDNDILRSLGEVGFLGTLAFALVLFAVLKPLIRMLKFQDKFLRFFVAGVIAMILAFVINGTFIDVFEASKVATLFWMMVGTALAVEKMR